MGYERPEDGTMKVKKYESVYGKAFPAVILFAIVVSVAIGLMIKGF